MKNKTIILTTLAPVSHRTSEENLGLAYLKSSLELNNYNVVIIDGWLNNYSVVEINNKIKTYDDVLFVGISSYMTNTKPTLELIDKLKNDNYITVCGGFGPTFYPKEYLDYGVDFVIFGEGENTIVSLANALSNNLTFQNINGLCFKQDKNIIYNDKPLLPNLDTYPFPARDTINLVLDKKSTVNIATSRGCTGNCEFCSVVAFFSKCSGKNWRTRSIKNIVDEIEGLYNQGINHIKVVDDSFVDGTRDEKWCENFADEIKKRNIKVILRGQIRADKITESILYYLKQAGFYSFACGIENGSSTALKRMNKTATLEDNENALNLFKQYNYIVQMGFILFDQNTTIKELWENYYFLEKYIFAITKGVFSEMYIAEGTKVNDTLKNNNQLKKGTFINGNNSYNLINNDVLKVYQVLKKWHKSHSYIYDMAVDPISAPKTISSEGRNALMDIALKLKKQDLIILKKVLETVKDEINIENEIIKTNSFYEDNYKLVKKIYQKENLYYDGKIIPFIK